MRTLLRKIRKIKSIEDEIRQEVRIKTAQALMRVGSSNKKTILYPAIKEEKTMCQE